MSVLDIPAEQVIAIGRLTLAVWSTFAVYVDPSEPARFVVVAYGVLLFYCAFALTALIVASKWRVPAGWQVGSHVIDLLVIGTVVAITQGPLSPFFAFFTFMLLAATLRWSWQGVLGTAAALVLLYLAISALSAHLGAPPEPGDDQEIARVLIRGAYLMVAAGMLCYVTVHRTRQRQRLTRLAQWPEYPHPASGHGLGAVLAHAAQILSAPRLIVCWEDLNAAAKHSVQWQDGATGNNVELCAQWRLALSPELVDLAFTSEDVSTPWVVLDQGPRCLPRAAVDPKLAAAERITGLASAPFSGVSARGRLFAFDRTFWGDDHLLLCEIVAARIGSELDRQHFQRQLAHAAAEQIRYRFARDLHDGTLQTLTAAGLQLELAERERSTDRIREVCRLLASETERIREQVMQMQRRESVEVEREVLPRLSLLTEDVAKQWNCSVALRVWPESMTLSEDMIVQVSFLLREAIANAVRHGGASEIDIFVRKAEAQLYLEVRDNGPVVRRPNGSLWNAEARAPLSISQRVSGLGGTFAVVRSPDATQLEVKLPIL